MKKYINILLTYPENDIKRIRQIKEKTIKDNNIHNLIDLDNYINKIDLLDDYGAHSLEYDIKIEKDIIYYLAIKNGSINWNPDYNMFDIQDLFKINNEDEILIRAYPGIGGVFNELILPVILSAIYDVLKFIVLNIFKLSNAISYKMLYKQTFKEKDYINEIILRSNKWKKGFITDNDFKFKSFCEKNIMKKLNYKINNGYWMRIK